MSKAANLITLTLVAALLMFLFGCVDSSVPSVPFSASQFVSKTTDLNYLLFSQGYYDGNFLVVDGNKLSAENDSNFFGNQIYGGVWGKSEVGFTTLTLGAANSYFSLKDLNAGSLNGFVFSDSNLVAVYSGLYMVTVSSSIDSDKAGEVGAKLFVNEVGQANCYSHYDFTVGKTANMGYNCLVRLVVGDKVSMRFDDHASPASVLTFVSANMTLVRIGK